MNYEDLIKIGIEPLETFSEAQHSEMGMHSVLKVVKMKYNLMVSAFEGNWVKRKTVVSYLLKKESKRKTESKNSFNNEVILTSIIRYYSCRFIGRYLQPSKNERALYMPIEKMTLANFIMALNEKRIIFSLQHKLELFYQLIEGICFLTFVKICHRDIKPPNILLSRHLLPRIRDFGSSCCFYSTNDRVAGNKQRNCAIIFSINFRILCSERLPQHFTQNPKTL